MRIDKQSIVLFVAGLAVVFALQFLMQKKQDADVVFCRNMYTQLAKGSTDAERYIDWEHFRALEYDVGAEYNRLANPRDKFNYRESFIKGCAAGFQYFQGELIKFTNWRIYSRSPDRVVVACDHPKTHNTLLFTFSKSGTKRKWVALEWKK